jgi:hypothetical protein
LASYGVVIAAAVAASKGDDLEPMGALPCVCGWFGLACIASILAVASLCTGERRGWMVTLSLSFAWLPAAVTVLAAFWA